MNMKNKQVQLSDIFERVYRPGGEGYVGFTVFMGNDKFKNYQEYFTPQTHGEVKDRILHLYSQYQVLMFGGIPRKRA